MLKCSFAIPLSRNEGDDGIIVPLLGYDGLTVELFSLDVLADDGINGTVCLQFSQSGIELL